VYVLYVAQHSISVPLMVANPPIRGLSPVWLMRVARVVIDGKAKVATGMISSVFVGLANVHNHNPIPCAPPPPPRPLHRNTITALPHAH
jgi:hypothetical protein